MTNLIKNHEKLGVLNKLTYADQASKIAELINQSAAHYLNSSTFSKMSKREQDQYILMIADAIYFFHFAENIAKKILNQEGGKK